MIAAIPIALIRYLSSSVLLSRTSYKTNTICCHRIDVFVYVPSDSTSENYVYSDLQIERFDMAQFRRHPHCQLLCSLLKDLLVSSSLTLDCNNCYSTCKTFIGGFSGKVRRNVD